MDLKKIGIWCGGFIGSFIVLLAIIYFLYPIINPEVASKVAGQKKPTAEQATYDPSRYNLQAVDSLSQEISRKQATIDSLIQVKAESEHMIDSLKNRLAASVDSQKEPKPMATKSKAKDLPAIKEATKPLLGLDEDKLAPIVDLLDDRQLLNLYREGSGREREKLLRTLKPEKAAKILKQVM